MKSLKLRLDDRSLGILGVVLGTCVLVLTPTMVRSSTALVPGSDLVFVRGDFYPRVIAVLLIVVGSWLFITDHFYRSRGYTPTEWPGHTISKREYAGAFGFLGLGTVYILMLINIGFMVSSAMAFSVLARGLGGRLGWSVLIGVILSIALELVFGRLFGIPLPGRVL